ncbi:MAG: tRNA 2-selenouridine(34) synthase MnmH, partial [Chrysiogenales bacterium]
PQRVYIDVRSPSEFEIDSVIGAVNIPLFDDNERREVGTIYRMAGRDDAVIRGTAIAGEKLKELIEAFMRYRDNNIVILCARGGMRSGSIASLLASLGLTVFRLKDGYKGYRRHIVKQTGEMTLTAPLFVLQGLTGTGKTEIIRALPHSIDLEGMAGHRSSVFGGIGLASRSQKRFESLIMGRLDSLHGASHFIVEGESRKIGNLHIPDRFHAMMQAAPVILIEASMERRQEILLREYRDFCDDENIPAIVKSLTMKLGHAQIARLLDLYSRGNLGEFIRILLEKYYDPLYMHTLKRKDCIARIENRGTDAAAAAVQSAIEGYLGQGTSGPTVR